MVKKPHSKGRHFQIKIFFFKTYLLLIFLTILYMYTVYLVWAVQMAQSLKARLTTKGQHSLLSASPKKPPDTTYTSPPLSWPLYSWSFFLFNPLSPVKLSAWMLTGIPGLILSRQPKHCCEFLGALPSQVQRTAFQNTSTSSGSFALSTPSSAALLVPRGIDKAVPRRSTQQSLVHRTLTNHEPTLTTTKAFLAKAEISRNTWV